MQRDSSSGGGRVFSFLIAFTVLFVVVFGLGVFVGKRLSQQELKITKRFDEAPPEPSLAPVEEAPETEAEQISESPSPVTEEAGIESPPPAVPAAGFEEKEVQKKNVEKESDAVKEVKEAAAPERTDTAAPVKPDERLAEITREIERELDKKTAGKKNEAETAKSTLPQVDPDGVYTVQIGSFQDQKQANSLASALQSKGYPVFIKSMASPDNKNWYRVRVGTFGNIEAAKAYGESLKNSEPSVKLVFITVNN
ncbi:MAG: SPOR domain-containing protein [Thermodesulfobacteriota bacterium]